MIGKHPLKTSRLLTFHRQTHGCPDRIVRSSVLPGAASDLGWFQALPHLGSKRKRMRDLLTKAQVVGHNLWKVELPPSQVQKLGRPKQRRAGPSVVLADVEKIEHANDQSVISLIACTVLNLGSSNEAIFVLNNLAKHLNREKLN